MAKKRPPVTNKAKVTDVIEWVTIKPKEKGVKRGVVVKELENSVIVEMSGSHDKTVVAHHRYKIIEVGEGMPVRDSAPKKGKIFNPDMNKINEAKKGEKR